MALTRHKHDSVNIDWNTFNSTTANNSKPILGDVITVKCLENFQIYKGKDKWVCELRLDKTTSYWINYPGTVCRETCPFDSQEKFKKNNPPTSAILNPNKGYIFWNYTQTFGCSAEPGRVFILVGDHPVWYCFQNHTYNHTENDIPKCVYECLLDFSRPNGTLYLLSHWSPLVTNLNQTLDSYNQSLLPRNGDMVRLECEPGYGVKGSVTAECSEEYTGSNIWSRGYHKVGECIGLCPANETRGNGTLMLTSHYKLPITSQNMPLANFINNPPGLADEARLKCLPNFSPFGEGKVNGRCSQIMVGGVEIRAFHDIKECKATCPFPTNFTRKYGNGVSRVTPSEGTVIFSGSNVTFACSDQSSRLFLTVGDYKVWNCLDIHHYDHDRFPSCRYECPLDLSRPNGTLYLQSYWHWHHWDNSLNQSVESYSKTIIPRDGDIVRLECEPGYGLKGSATAACSEEERDTNWVRGFHGLGECIGLCPANETRGNGTLVLTRHFKDTISIPAAGELLVNFLSNYPGIGDIARLDCSPDFSVSGKAEGPCSEHNIGGVEVRAFHSIGECKATCPFPTNFTQLNAGESIGFVTPSDGVIFAGTNVTFSCSKISTRPFVAVGGWSVWNCLDTHQYDHDIFPSCQYECPLDFSRPNGTVYIHSHWSSVVTVNQPFDPYNQSLPARTGDKVRLKCDSGFGLRGNDTAECSEKLSYGEWIRGFHGLGDCIGLCAADESRTNGKLILTSHYKVKIPTNGIPLRNFTTNLPAIEDSARLECSPNFTVIGKADGKCSTRVVEGVPVRKFHDINECKALCPLPTTFTHLYDSGIGLVTPSTDPIYEGSTVTFKCSDDEKRPFITEGGYNVWKCLSTHKFDHVTFPSCQYECPSDFPTPNGHLTLVSHWSAHVTSISPQPLSNFSDAIFGLPRNGDEAKLICDQGYALVGNDTAQCSERLVAGDWQRGFHGVGQCKGFCLTDETRGNGTLFLKTHYNVSETMAGDTQLSQFGIDKPMIGDIATLVCNPGFRITMNKVGECSVRVLSSVGSVMGFHDIGECVVPFTDNLCEPSESVIAQVRGAVRKGDLSKVFAPPERKKIVENEALLIPELPMNKLEKAVADTFQAMGCCWLIAILGFTICSFFLLRIKDYERVFHFNEEFSLLLAMLLLMFFRDETGNKLICTATSATTLYLYMVEFTFLAMESYHVMSYNANMMNQKPMLAWPLVAVIGWATPAMVMLCVVAPQYKHLTSQWSCWLNYGHSDILLPIGGILMGLFVISLIMVEAGHFYQNSLPTMDKSSYYWRRSLPMVDKTRHNIIKVSSYGLLILLPLNFVTFYFGSMAVYYMDISLYSTVFALHLSLGIAFWIFHTLSERKVQSFINKATGIAWIFCYRLVIPS